MNFLMAKEYIEGLNRYGSVLGLDNIYKLLEKLNNPQKELKVVHVAGTNGKGSTITYISNILGEAGKKVGCYTSPVVFEYLEKYKINNKNIGEEAFAKLVSEAKVAIAALNDVGVYPTIFEVETAMAFLYFSKEKVDVAIIETGMGGDLDATNVLDKVCLSVITSISYDHMTYLGNSLEEITMHKAGIIKNECPICINANNNITKNELLKYAKEKNSKIYLATKIKKGEYKTQNNITISQIKSCMEGSFQDENMALAIEAVFALKENYPEEFNISTKCILEGIAKAYIGGRFEKIHESPNIYIDGAHNPDAIVKLKNTINSVCGNEPVVFIMGVLADKDYDAECEIIAKMAKHIITIESRNSRALPAAKLAKTIEKYNKNVQCENELSNAIIKAASFGTKNIIVFGSLSHLGDIKATVDSLTKKGVI